MDKFHSAFGHWELTDCPSVSEDLSRIQVSDFVQSRLSPAGNFDAFILLATFHFPII